MVGVFFEDSFVGNGVKVAIAAVGVFAVASPFGVVVGSVARGDSDGSAVDNGVKIAVTDVASDV